MWLTPKSKREDKNRWRMNIKKIIMNLKKVNEPLGLRVALMPWQGIELANAAIISKQVVDSGILTSTIIRKVEVEFNKDEFFIKEDLDFFKGKNHNLDETGVVRVGSMVQYSDLLAVKGVKKAVTAEEKLMQAIFGDNRVVRSVSMTYPEKGLVIDISKYENMVTITMAFKRILQIGDVLQYSNGREIVIVDIVDPKNMPYVKNSGIQLDMVIVGSERSNLPNPENFSNDPLAVVYSLKNPGFVLLAPPKKRHKSKEWEFKNEHAFVGIISFKKVEQMLENKFKASGLIDYRNMYWQNLVGAIVNKSLLTNLVDNGCFNLANEIFSVKSDSINSHKEMYENIIDFRDEDVIGSSLSLKNLALISNAMGFTVSTISQLGKKEEISIEVYDKAQKNKVSEKIAFEYIGLDLIANRSNGEVTESDAFDRKGIIKEGGLFCEKIFGSRSKIMNKFNCFGHINLAVPLINPLFKKELIEYQQLLEEDPCSEEFSEGSAIEIFSKKLLMRIKNKGLNPKAITHSIPVLPYFLRPIKQRADKTYSSNDLNFLYRVVVLRNNLLKKFININAPVMIVSMYIKMLQEALNSLFNDSGKIGERFFYEGLLSKFNLCREIIFTKRSSYSARSIVVPDLSLTEDVCSIPARMAAKIFEPFIIRNLKDNKFADEEERYPFLTLKENQ